MVSRVEQCEELVPYAVKRVSIEIKINHMLDVGGMSDRKIANTVGCSRSKVRRIRICRFGVEGEVVKKVDEWEPTGNIYRCPNCRVMVQEPCLRCWILARKSEKGFKGF